MPNIGFSIGKCDQYMDGQTPGSPTVVVGPRRLRYGKGPNGEKVIDIFTACSYSFTCKNTLCGLSGAARQAIQERSKEKALAAGGG